MLGKAATHIRPYLRLHPSPEPFSSNPSLLHHLPSGVSNTLVTSKSSPSPSQPNGTGRTYGGSGPGAGQQGYQGHARAFLSLPQTNAVDPTTSLTNDDNNGRKRRVSFREVVGYGKDKDKEKEKIVRVVRFDQERPKLRLLDIELYQEKVSELGSGERFRIESTEIPVIDQIEVNLGSTGENLLVSDGRDGRYLEFEDNSLYPIAGPSYSTSLHKRPEFGRSKSTVDLWQAGLPPSNRIESRPLHTRSSSRVGEQIPKLVIRKSQSGGIRFEQDLAGILYSRPKSSTVNRSRRYTVAASQRPSLDSPPAQSSPVSNPATETSLNKLDDKNNQLDARIYQAIRQATKSMDRARINVLVNHYRSPRSASPFSTKTPTPTSKPYSLSSEFPLPNGWSTHTYNACLTALVQTRQKGDSIAPVLDIYNEMLERDIVPNLGTHINVIRSLCARELDIRNLINDTKLRTKAQQWEQEKLGISHLPDRFDDMETIELFNAEKNVETALRIYKHSIVERGLIRYLPSIVFRDLVLACASRDPPDTINIDKIMMSVLNLPEKSFWMLSLYGPTLRAHGRKGNANAVNSHWNAFLRYSTSIENNLSDKENYHQKVLEDEDGGSSSILDDAIDGKSLDGNSGELDIYNKSFTNMKLHVYVDAITSFALINDIPRVNELFEQMLNPSSSSIPSLNEFVFSHIIIALAREGHPDLSLNLLNRLNSHPTKSHLLHTDITIESISRLITNLCQIDRWSEAYNLVETFILPEKKLKQYKTPSFLRSLTGLMLVTAEQSSEEQAKEVSEKLGEIMKTFNLYILYPELIVRHLLLMVKYGYLEVISQTIENTLQKGWKGLYDLSGVKTVIEMIVNGQGNDPFEVLECLVQLKRLDVHVDQEQARKLLEKYDSEWFQLDLLARQSQSSNQDDPIQDTTQENVSTSLDINSPKPTLSSHQWKILIDALVQQPEIELMEGMWDSMFEKLLLLGKKFKITLEESERLSKTAGIEMLGKTLVYRFGQSKSREMLLPIFGKQTENLIKLPEPEPETETTTTINDKINMDESISNTQVDEINPESYPVTSTLTNEPVWSNKRMNDGNTPIIDFPLSNKVDGHNRRNPQISIWKAYELLISGFENGRYVHPEITSKLIISISRPFPKSSFKSQSQSQLQSQSQPQSQSQSLRNHYQPQTSQQNRNENQPTSQQISTAISQLYKISSSSLSLLPTMAQPKAWRSLEDSMIIASCHLGQLEQAGLHRTRMLEKGFVPSSDAYATMISSCKNTTDDAAVAREMWEESQRLGVKPHLFLYNTVISRLSKARKADEVLVLFERMRKEGWRPTSVTYGAVINACCRVGDAESAEILFKEMTAQPNFKPHVPPFNIMMQFYLQTRPSREKVLHYYSALCQAKVPPSSHTYKLLLDAYATLPPPDIPSMESVFSQLQADPFVSVQGTHWASLINAYGLAVGDVSKALETFDSIPSHPSSQANVPEPVVWEAILSVIASKGTLEELESMRLRLQNTGTRPTAYVYNVLISGYARHGLIDKSRDIFEHMADGITGVAAPNNHPLLLTSSGHTKPSTVEEESKLVYREPSTYEAMIHAELRCGDRDAAEAVCRRMEERGYPMAVYMKARAALDGSVSVPVEMTYPAFWSPHLSGIPLAETPFASPPHVQV
ncbi:hypothetical protein M231_04516 [Tremella mesenterica]|uniref:Pentacotripeptide-repeat region of PRORP domain-containing protein n=2 Tax=Tremella mesenterica TaxID=5217 RepID=A0A4Q1BKU2_TREME|nr:hypothetical protein M231_04516 [Tremella mesenterica]